MHGSSFGQSRVGVGSQVPKGKIPPLPLNQPDTAPHASGAAGRGVGSDQFSLILQRSRI